VSANVLVETSRREKEREGNWWLDRGGGCPHLKLYPSLADCSSKNENMLEITTSFVYV
jgi:hypothetical protein